MTDVHENKQNQGLNRRDFFKVSGLVGAAVGAAGVAGAGLANGRTFRTFTGWENMEGEEYFNREPFRVDKPTYKVTGEIQRVDWKDRVFDRDPALKAQWYDSKLGEAGLDAELREYYRQHPKKLELDRYRQEVVLPQAKKDNEELKDRYVLSKIWADSWKAVEPEKPGRPEEWDWKDVAKPAYELTDPAQMARLIKKVASTFGATLVGITRLNPAWVYKNTGRAGRGYAEHEPIDVPGWWEYAIVLGTPHEWDLVYSNPTYGTSSDAYNRSSIAAARLTTFIKALGYPARPHSPNTGYELMVPPIVIDAGLGEQGRFGFAITPELGGNFRPAVVTTNLPMEIDRPVNMHLKDFCMKCKLCAELCPSRSIPFDEPKEIRGVVKWSIDQETCLNYWRSVPGSGSCRLCLAVCPWSRKNNWVHGAAREVAMRDPSGLVASGLTWAQKTIYEIPDPTSFHRPNFGSYREAPWWVRPEDFLKLK